MAICNLDHFEEAYWQDKKFVLVGGAFDPLHEGHVEYFVQARKLGPLVCALTPDQELRQKRTPFLPEMTRLKVLNACALVEHVHLAIHGIPAVIRALKPSHYVVGKDWLSCFPQESLEACADVGAELVFVGCRENASSSLLADYERRRSAEKLAALEAFVGQQKPAEKPWEPVTDYSRETRRAIEAPQADIIAEVFKGCSVLDYGCGFGYLVDLLRERGMKTYGYDPAFSPAMWSGKPDVIVCREVLEHTTARDASWIVRKLCRSSGKYIYVTTRFTAKSHLLDVDGSDDLDPTHITLLNQDLLRTLFVLEGCTRRADLEAKLDHQKKGRVLVYEVPR